MNRSQVLPLGGLVALSSLALFSCGDSSSSAAHAAVAAAKAADPTTPEGAMAIALADLKTGKVTSFFEKVMPVGSLSGLRDEWNQFKAKGMSLNEAAQFNEMLRSLTVRDSELLLFEKIKPSLEGAETQLASIASMGPMLASGALGEMDVEAEKGLAAIQTMATALSKIDIGSEKKAKKAIDILCHTARRLRISNAHALGRLEFEEAFGKLDVMYVGLLDILDVYGVSLDESIHSMNARTIAVDGDTAYMELTMTLFGEESAPVPFEMKRVQDRWELRLKKEIAE